MYLHCEPAALMGAISSVNEDISAVLEWTQRNKLILNSDKAIIIRTSRFINTIDLSAIPEIKVEQSIIKYSSHIRYLGVTIMNNLSWEKQVTSMTNNCKLYQLKLSKHLLPDALKIRHVVSLIFPHIDYCCAVYTDMTAELNLRLYRAINSCIRFIFNLKADIHITPYYEKLRWLKITLRPLTERNTDKASYARSPSDRAITSLRKCGNQGKRNKEIAKMQPKKSYLEAK
ncbi:uncharacterized protein LOC115244755 [Formica exsecta]|uniref:uncharacterized protein LOC115244755 n=1 Tax=Formica exsecta TaxID=72781 RepID=UPI0011433B6C|nr:uncharacterized protein LOC115244755 [Formica exsecta]